MKTIKGLLGYVGFGVSAIISQGRQALGPGSLETGTGRKAPPGLCSPASFCHSGSRYDPILLGQF